MPLNNQTKPMTLTKRSRRSFACTMHLWLTICFLCGTTFNCLVNSQLDKEEKQQEHQQTLHNYQQQQPNGQQQLKLQQQQRQRTLQPLSSSEIGVLPSIKAHMQMLKDRKRIREYGSSIDGVTAVIKSNKQERTLPSISFSPIHMTPERPMELNQNINSAAYLRYASAEIENNNTIGNSSFEAIKSHKNKFTFLAFNRLKSLGASLRRARATQSPSIYAELSSKTPKMFFSATTSTVKSRFKKPAQQQSTLKPLLMLIIKSDPTAASTSTPTKIIIDTKTPNANDSKRNFINKRNYKKEFEDRKRILSITETTPVDEASRMQKIPPAANKTLVNSASTSTATMANNSNGDRNRYWLSYEQHNLSKFKNDVDTIAHQKKDDSRKITDVDKLNNIFKIVSIESSERKIGKNSSSKGEKKRIDQIQAEKHHQHKPILSFRTTAKTTSSSLKQSIPDFATIDDRAELLEMVEDGHTLNILFKLLQQQNMTIDQLMEHRKRGASELQIATVIEEDSKSQNFPGQKLVLHENLDIITAFENFPHFNRINLKNLKPEDIKTDSESSSYFTSVVGTVPNDAEKTANDDDSLKDDLDGN